jgi:hypothetical protein
MKASEIMIGVLVLAFAAALFATALKRRLTRRRPRRDDEPILWI